MQQKFPAFSSTGKKAVPLKFLHPRRLIRPQSSLMISSGRELRLGRQQYEGLSRFSSRPVNDWGRDDERDDWGRDDERDDWGRDDERDDWG